MENSAVIAGDIGGTKSILSLAGVVNGRVSLSHKRRFKSQEYSSLEEIVIEFIKGSGGADDIRAACLGIAGPVRGGKSDATNLPWTIDQGIIEKESGLAKVTLINDFKSIAYGIPYLEDNDYFVLNEGAIDPEGPIAIIGAGTGLGEGLAIYVPSKNGYEVIASEGGHSDFAPNNEEEIRLLRHLFTKFRHVSYERLLSGQGLLNIYNYLLDTKQNTPSDATAAAIKNGDPAAAISEAALNKRDEICVRSLDIFSSIYGAEAGNLALKFLPSGGLYLAGGMAPKILETLKEGRFMRSFLNKGRLSGFLESIPVRVILNEEVGLIGSAVRGVELLTNFQTQIQ